MALFFYIYIGKFGFNIFPDLKIEQIKYKTTKFAHFFVILTKTKFVYIKTLVSQKLYPQSIN